MPEIEPDWAPEAPAFRLRAYQQQWVNQVQADRATRSRVVIEAPGGAGKSRVAGALALTEWQRYGGRTLVLENRDGLVRQMAKAIAEQTGLTVEIEMGSERASPFAQVVVASVPSLGRIARLTGFADTHFSLIIPDETHLMVAPQPLRIMKFFHYGAESLAEDWKAPKDGEYQPKCLIVGTTATPEEKMGRFFQGFVEPRYTYLQAVDDGWLVPPVAISEPIKLDFKQLRRAKTVNGVDYRPEDVAAAIIPIIDELADQIVRLAPDRKTMTFLPSVECARLMAEALRRKGLDAIFVSGECLDVDEKTERFIRAGRGTVLCNCALYVAGRDFPDVDCIAWYRPSLSRSFVIQGFYRGSRVLPGLVDDDMTPEARKAAIAASAKPNMLIIDPFYRTDEFDLVTYIDLIADNPEKKKHLLDLPDGADLMAEAQRAERDFVKSLEEEAKKQARKEARMINPLTHSLSLDLDTIKNYEAKEAWQAKPVNDFQREGLLNFGFNPNDVKDAGMADLILKRVHDRKAMKLASPKQIEALRRMRKIVDGRPVPMFTDAELTVMPMGKAGAILARESAKWRAKEGRKIAEWNRAMS